MGWLGRQLAWEDVLTRLRVAAGVLPPGAIHRAWAHEDRDRPAA